jgi:hypothetical protein
MPRRRANPETCPSSGTRLLSYSAETYHRYATVNSDSVRSMSGHGALTRRAVTFTLAIPPAYSAWKLNGDR